MRGGLGTPGLLQPWKPKMIDLAVGILDRRERDNPLKGGENPWMQARDELRMWSRLGTRVRSPGNGSPGGPSLRP